MSVPAGTPGDEVPEADWAEQGVEAGPPADGGTVAPPVLGTRSFEAEPADVVEQELPVDYDEDEH